MGTIDPAQRRGSRAGVLAGILFAGLLVLLGAAPASAHDYLVSSSPAAGSTVRTPPSAVTLTFDAAVLGTGNGSTVLAVTGAGGRHFETACPTVRNAAVSAPVRLGAAGTYTVTWRIVSADGHPVSDAIRFHYAPPAGTAAAAGSASGPSCGDAAVRTGLSVPAPSSAGGIVVLVAVAVVAGVLVLLVAAVVIVAIVLTRRRS